MRDGESKRTLGSVGFRDEGLRFEVREFLKARGP